MPATDIDFGASAREGWRIGEMFANVIVNIGLFLIRPLGVLTQVFFRKDMGERYLTPLTVTVALLLVLLAYRMTVTTVPPTPLIDLYARWSEAKVVETLAFRNCKYWIPGIWTTLFAAAVWENKVRSWMRYRRGERWHSRSMGSPRIPGLGNLFQYILTALAAVSLEWMTLSWMALLVCLSLAATVITDYAVARQLYNSVLDALDGQLESETLNQAINERLTPKQLNGITLRLPKSLRQYLQQHGGNPANIPATAVSVIEQKPAHAAVATAV